VSGEYRSRHRSKTARRIKKPNSPPLDQPWIWLTREIMESLAWRSLSLAAKQALDRVMLEHMAHAGCMNGELIILYDDFVKHGIDRRSIAKAIDICVCLGFLDLIQRGIRAYGPARRPSVYGLTWLDRCDRTFATNRWRNIRTDQDVAAAMAEVESCAEERSRAHKERHAEHAEGKELHRTAGLV
jgi:hypothetical protein